MNKSKPLILVDGSSYLYRAFHAMPSLSNSKGEPTGAIYGVINMVRRLLKDYEPELIAIVFDAKGKTFRDELYPEYKAHRPPMPQELHAQIGPLHQILAAMGLPILTIEGVEADDVIGTLTAEATRHKTDVIVSTGDKDIAQLVNEHVTLVNTMTDTVLDEQGVVEKFGVPPNRIIDYLTLIGDTVDNVPGVPKVGPKTAVKWLQTYDSLDGVVAHVNEITGKVGEHLREALPILPLSKQLVTIRCDVALPMHFTELKLSPPDLPQLVDLYKRFELKTWLKEAIEQTGEPATETSAKNADTVAPRSEAKPASQYHAILTESAFEDLLQKLKHAAAFAVDTETTSLNYMEAELVGLSFCITSGEAYYIPVAHHYLGAPVQLDRASVLARLKPLLENTSQVKIGQNLKYDMNVLARYGIHLQNVAFDTMLESYVLDSVATRHDMDTLALKYLGHKTISYEDVTGKGAKQIGFDQVAVDVATNYAAEDADITLQLHESLWPKIAEYPTLRRVFETIEMPLVPVLSRMERTGVFIDTTLLAKQSEFLAHRILEVEKMAFHEAGQTFNLGSPKQIQSILYDQQKLPVLQKTPTGQASTAENVLQELAEDYVLPRLILEHRSLSKLKSTYTDRLPEQVSTATGRVHTSYHQAVAATGRLSSSDPNLQNIPVRSEEGRRIRQAFIAPPGCKIVAADYSQIELRIMAHLSRDPRLLQAFKTGEDIHRATAAEILGTKPEDVDTEARRRAKAINFGLIYGMSAFGLAKQLGIERGEAQKYMDHYFDCYPGVKQYMETIRLRAREYGYVETVFGRRLYLSDINASNAQRRQYAERTAINAPMQGTAADIIKLAMIQVDRWLQNDASTRLIMQVHDELVFEVEESAVQESTKRIRELMESAAELTVPLIVDIGVGDNWDEAH